MNPVQSQSGSALLIALAIMLLLFGAVMLSVDTSITESDLSFNQLYSDKAFYVAQAGIEQATAMLDFDETWRSGFANQSFDQGTFAVIVRDSVVQPALAETVLVRSSGQCDKATSTVEVLLIQESYHPLYNHAIYAGNYNEYDPALDSQLWAATMSFGGVGLESDRITGDVFFNGHIDVGGGAILDGDAMAGGDYTGTAPTGSTSTDEEYLEPPDLLAESYATTADFYVGDSEPFDANGWLPNSDPRHIFVKEYRSDLAVTVGYPFDNTNYFFGDPYEGPNIDRVSVSAAGNQKTYFVDGNLWIEPNGITSQLVGGPAGGTQITVVVKGNIYFSDNLSYQNNARTTIWTVWPSSP